MPVGNLSTDTETNFKIDKVEVYDTLEHPDLLETLTNLLKAEDKCLILAFFSPSAVRAAVSCINENMHKYLKVNTSPFKKKNKKKQ